MKKYLSLFLIAWLIGLSLPTQVMAGECTHFIEERDYTVDAPIGSNEIEISPMYLNDVQKSEIVRILKANSPRRKSVGPSIPIDNKNVEIISGGQNNDNSGVGIISGGFNSDDSTAIIIKNQ